MNATGDLGDGRTNGVLSQTGHYCPLIFFFHFFLSLPKESPVIIIIVVITAGGGEAASGVEVSGVEATEE